MRRIKNERQKNLEKVMDQKCTNGRREQETIKKTASYPGVNSQRTGLCFKLASTWARKSLQRRDTQRYCSQDYIYLGRTLLGLLAHIY
jgi:hypothetical protein